MLSGGGGGSDPTSITASNQGGDTASISRVLSTVESGVPLRRPRGGPQYAGITDANSG